MSLPGWWRERRARVLQLWGVGMAASLLVTAASSLGYLEALQARSADILIHLQGQRFAPEVVVVAIDEEAFESLGRRQPLPRDYLARLLRGLQRAGAAVVGVDMAFSTPTTEADDGALARAITDFSDGGVSRVVLVEAPPPRTGPLADPAFLGSVLRGAADVPLDRDGVIRRVALLLPRGSEPPLPALSLAVVARLAGLTRGMLEISLRERGGISPPAWRVGGGWSLVGTPALALRSNELWRINYVGPAGSFLAIPSGAVVALAEDTAELAADNPLRGRIVLVGGTYGESRDFYPTPHGSIAGVEVHANVIHMLVTGSHIRPSGWVRSLAFQIAIVMLAGVVMAILRPLAGTLVCLTAAVLLGVPASYLAFQRSGYWVDFLLPVIVTSLLGLVAEGLARRRFRDSFGRYVSREIAAQVLAEAPSLRGERRAVSILFSDLRGFTTLSETMPAEQVAARLTEYFEAMTAAIFAHRGMINDFVGDGIVAIFGAPLADAEHAWHAVLSAEAMQRALDGLNRRWSAAGLPTLRMGIGVHTGQVFVGNVGGAARVKYTVVGDPVNLASRVEGLNKELGTTILITEETRALAGERVEAKDRGLMAVKGRSQPVHVHELLAVHAERCPPPGGGAT
ncbi:MAG: adenylate/guanylate cyclase domain-containing protein [Candidatus Rokubacteria bacterium]|nr:adenylate/guanylate cyclase domain-containing protein [Candidatus Rokubacteria bacterium]